MDTSVSPRVNGFTRKRVRDPALGVIGVLGLTELIATKRATVDRKTLQISR